MAPPGCREGPCKAFPHFESRGGHIHSPYQGYHTLVSVTLGALAPGPAKLCLGRSLHAAPLGRHEALRKVLPHFESRGGHTSPPPNKVIAHPSRRPRGVWPPPPNKAIAHLSFGPRTCGHYCREGLSTRLPAGALRPLAKPCPIPSPTGTTTPCPPPTI